MWQCWQIRQGRRIHRWEQARAHQVEQWPWFSSHKGRQWAFLRLGETHGSGGITRRCGGFGLLLGSGVSLLLAPFLCDAQSELGGLEHLAERRRRRLGR